MKTLLDPSTREEIITRIARIDRNAGRQWGTMSVYQMLRHCTVWEDMMTGKIKAKRVFVGRLFGRLALKSVLKDDSPLRRSTPSAPELINKEETGNIDRQKQEWIDRIRQYAQYPVKGIMHPFFGWMTLDQIGRMAYKHADHHLRQFAG